MVNKRKKEISLPKK